VTDDQGRNPATDHTRSVRRAFVDRLPANAEIDFENVRRGFIARPENPVVENTGSAAEWSPVAWDTSRWDFVQGDAPDTVNPSLWRQALLNGEHGLFEVIAGFYQVRSLDTSCTTFIRGTDGWVVVDPLTTTETGRVAYDLVREHLEDLPVTAVIYTHSHVDHYGGILGMVDRDRIDAGDVPIVAPEGFLSAAVAENVAAGAAMGRRATYQYGMLLDWDERGHVDQGLGKGVPIGSISMVPPTIEITETGQELTLDGVRVQFQLTPNTEAPAEMHFWFPDHNALCLAENCTGTLHNVLTLRGAVVRDALAWSRYIDAAIDDHGDQVEVCFASHSWPRWGRDEVIGHMTRQRDLYRWIHDQTMRLANLGHTPDEIAEQVDLPPGLWADWSCHGYYGTVSHNVRAVFQRYLGWYDGHPSSLEPHPPTASAVRYVEFMGGMENLLANARRSYDEGDYRWVAQVLRHAVFAEPDNHDARHLQADAFEQLGYQAEAGPWRDVYLMGAMELRQGTLEVDFAVRPILEAAQGMTLEQVFDYLAVRLDGPAAAEMGDLRLTWTVSDPHDVVRVTLSNGTLHAVVGHQADAPDAELSCPRRVLDDLVASGDTLRDRVADGEVEGSGDVEAVLALWDLFADFPMFFPIVEP
jgi:alkyl sulfatase BDS1-like metallo-beta-lactamase superfamily hydrolase